LADFIVFGGHFFAQYFSIFEYLTGYTDVTVRLNQATGRAFLQHRYYNIIGSTEPAMITEPTELIDKDEHIEQASRALKAMSHPLRLKILCVLGDKEVSVQDIVENVGTSQSNISQHLAILRDKGVLRTRKDANRVYYRVGDTRTLLLIGMMRDVFCGFSK
jgi:ArsR family transcriptional regulator